MCGWGWRRLIPLQSKRLAGNVARLGLGDRGIERKRGLSLAAVAGLRARRLGRIQNSPGPWVTSLGRGAFLWGEQRMGRIKRIGGSLILDPFN